MSLAHTSDDSLAVILSFLMGEDVLRLIAAGSKSLNARLVRNTTNLFWGFARPTYYPSCSFSFASLRSLTIKGSGRNAHISLHGRPLLPLEPMVSLQSLDLSFTDAHLVFSPVTSNKGLNLASSLPKLTSLAVRSETRSTLAHSWTETLPKGLLSLTMAINISSYDQDSFIDSSSFENLPSGLQHLNFGILCPIGVGKVNFKRFEDLRTLELLNTLSWEALDSLPDRLQNLRIMYWNDDDFGTPMATFPLSKLPPNIKVLVLTGPRLEIDFDMRAPHTLEEVELDLESDITVQNFERFLQTKNIRVALGVGPLTPESLALFPNVQRITGVTETRPALTTFEIIPRKLQMLVMPNSMRSSPLLPLKNLPPALKTLHCPLLSHEDIPDLPKSLTVLKLHRITPVKVPAAVWRELPPQLKRLDLDLKLFESEECFHALPDKIESLYLDVDSEASIAMLERATFPKSLQESAESLFCYIRDRNLINAECRTYSLFSKLSPFTRLTNLRFSLYLLIDCSTLSNLPKTLTELHLDAVNFENFGLPLGQDPEKRFDWKEGALSRLPEGLRGLQLQYATDSSVAIDHKLFSNLPRQLVSLYLRTRRPICENPKSFISMLPRRLSDLSYIYNKSKSESEVVKFGEHTINHAERELQEAIDEYYSDPFWSGQRYAMTS